MHHSILVRAARMMKGSIVTAASYYHAAKYKYIGLYLKAVTGLFSYFYILIILS